MKLYRFDGSVFEQYDDYWITNTDGKMVSTYIRGFKFLIISFPHMDSNTNQVLLMSEEPWLFFPLTGISMLCLSFFHVAVFLRTKNQKLREGNDTSQLLSALEDKLVAQVNQKLLEDNEQKEQKAPRDLDEEWQAIGMTVYAKALIHNLDSFTDIWYLATSQIYSAMIFWCLLASVACPNLIFFFKPQPCKYLNNSESSSFISYLKNVLVNLLGLTNVLKFHSEK